MICSGFFYLEIMELQQTLIDLGFKVRLDKDGNEMEKPEVGNYYDTQEPASPEVESWCNATEVIKLPDPVEFWKKVSAPLNANLYDILDSMNTYIDFIQTPLSKEMFVNEFEKPKGKRCCGGLQSGNNCDCKGQLIADQGDIFQWKEAEEKVLFHGWTKRKFEVSNRYAKTIHDLQNNGVQLYLKIK